MRLCYECGTEKDVSEFIDGRSDGYENPHAHTCTTCRAPSKLSANPVLLAKPPSVTQLDQLRRVSAVHYGDPEKVFDVFGTPTTRGEASDILVALDQVRAGDIDATRLIGKSREEMAMRTCAECGAEKPLDQFAKWGRGRKAECRDCMSPKAETSPPETPDQTDRVTLPVDAPSTNGIGETEGSVTFPESEGHHFALASDGKEADEHWCLAELRNPRLHVLRGIQHAVAEAIADAGTISLDEAAALAGQIADLDLS